MKTIASKVIQIACFFVAVISLIAVGSEGLRCPPKCSCRQESVTCRNVKEIPSNIPEETRRLQIVGLEGDLRADRLGRLTKLVGFKLERASGIIRSCAFKNLRFLKSLQIIDSRISKIERNAFTNLDNVFTIGLSKCNIRQIDTLAFSNILRSSVRLTGNTIGEVKSLAFYSSNSSVFIVTGNKFDAIRCLTFDTLDRYQLTLNNNNFTCSCDLFWALNETRLWSTLTSSSSFCGLSSSVYFRRRILNENVKKLLESTCTKTPPSCPNAAAFVPNLTCLNDTSESNFTSTTRPNVVCPSGCVCIKTFVTCTHTDGFPLIPRDTTEVILTGIRGTLSYGRLQNLTNLQYLRIEGGVNLTFQSCCMDGLKDVATVIVQDSDIRTIEANAFSNMNGLNNFLIQRCQIDVLKTMTFNNVSSSNVAILDNTIETVEWDAFHLSENNKYAIRRNTLKMVHCDSFNSLITSRSFSFQSNIFVCNCDIAWMKTERANFWEKIQYDNKCTFGITLNVFANAIQFCKNNLNNCNYLRTAWSPVCSLYSATKGITTRATSIGTTAIRTVTPDIKLSSTQTPRDKVSTTQTPRTKVSTTQTPRLNETTFDRHSPSTVKTTGDTTVPSAENMTTKTFESTPRLKTMTVSRRVTNITLPVVSTSHLVTSRPYPKITNVTTIKSSTNETELCPRGCRCVGQMALCELFREIPENLPRRITQLEIHKMTGDVDAGRLQRLEKLRLLRFSDSNLVFRACSLDGLSGLHSLQIDNSTVFIIEENAFANMIDIKDFTISKCTIGRVEPMAFNNMTNVALYMRENIISRVDSYAFWRCNLNEFTFVMNTFKRVSCLSFDGFLEAGREKKSEKKIERNIIFCDCHVNWFVDGRLELWQQIEEQNHCDIRVSLSRNEKISNCDNMSSCKADFIDKTPVCSLVNVTFSTPSPTRPTAPPYTMNFTDIHQTSTALRRPFSTPLLTRPTAPPYTMKFTDIHQTSTAPVTGPGTATPVIEPSNEGTQRFLPLPAFVNCITLAVVTMLSM